MEWLERLKILKSTTTETYKSIAIKTQIPQTTIEKLFSGRTRDPKLNMMRDIVHCLGYTLDDLIGENKEASAFKINDKHEKSLIQNYRSLSDQGKEYILQTMDMAVDRYKKDNISAETKKQIG